MLSLSFEIPEDLKNLVTQRSSFISATVMGVLRGVAGSKYHRCHK